MPDLPDQKNLDEIGQIARAVGWRAAEILHSYSYGAAASRLSVEDKKDGPVTSADLAVDRYILQQLRIALGSQDFGFLTEETYKSLPAAQKSIPVPQSWVWIIDPIDGTREFIKRTSNYAVHIALVCEGRPVVAVVVWPTEGKLYYAQLGAGAFVENPAGFRTPLQVSPRERLQELTVISGHNHRNERFNQLMRRLPCKNQRFGGSIGCKIAQIVEHEADVYISISGKSAPKDWDFAAPELILTEAGGRFTHADGTPLMYNQGDVTQWGCVIASNGHCHEDLCAQAQKVLTQGERKK